MRVFYRRNFILFQRISATLKRRNWFAGTRPEIAVRTYLKSYLSRLFAGDLAAFGGPSTEEAVAGQIRAEQISLVLRNSPGMMAANACNATVLGIALWQSPDGIYAALWAAVMAFGSTFSGLKARSSSRVSQTHFVVRPTLHHLLASTLHFGGIRASGASR